MLGTKGLFVAGCFLELQIVVDIGKLIFQAIILLKISILNEHSVSIE